MRTVTTYLDKNNNRTTKEKAWTVVSQIYNDAGNLQRTGYSKGPAQLAQQNQAEGTGLKLTVVDSGEIKCFSKNIVKLGRDAGCDLVIDLKADKKKIDKVHATFELKMGKWHIINHSKGGVWINDVKLAESSPKALETGDVIDIAQRYRIRFM